MYICTGQETGCVRDGTPSPPTSIPTHHRLFTRLYTVYLYRAGDRVCQRWDSQSPHSHPHTPQAHPDAGLEENFCRNPDNKERPWCYTTDAVWRWDYCDVVACAGKHHKFFTFPPCCPAKKLFHLLKNNGQCYIFFFLLRTFFPSFS